MGLEFDDDDDSQQQQHTEIELAAFDGEQHPSGGAAHVGLSARWKWLRTSADSCCGYARGYTLRGIDDTPDYLRHNPYILSGYRVDLPFRLALASLFHIHNETWNVWTHLGAMLVGMAFVLWASIHSTSFLSTLPLLDRSIFLIYIFSANILFTCSSTFHLLACIGQKQYTWLARMDYAGISILIVGSYCPVVFLAFKCQPWIAIAYYSAVCLVGVACVGVSFHPKFERPGYEIYRAGVYAALGFLGLIMAPHLLYLYGWALLPGLYRAFLVGGIYVSGMLIYYFQIPEFWFPGKFDCNFQSHMIWHVFVVAGTVAHYYVCQWMVSYQQTVLAPMCEAMMSSMS